MMKQVYGEGALDHNAVFKYHKHYAHGRDSLEDDEHTSHPRIARIEFKIQEVTLVHANHSKMIDEVAAAEISNGTCHKLLSDDLNMSRVSHYSVPCVLMQDQRGDHMSTCGHLIDSTGKDGTFLNWIITGDKTWCFLYDLQLKLQSATWKLLSWPRKKKP
jgi:hypothetical protein